MCLDDRFRREYRKSESAISAGLGPGNPLETLSESAPGEERAENRRLSRLFYATWVEPILGVIYSCSYALLAKYL